MVRLKCGDPGVFGRGAEEAAACDAAGVAWDIVPGVTAACAAGASARSFLTERGQSERLILATGHLRHDGVQDWRAAAQPGTTLEGYMGVAQSESIMRGLIGAGWPAHAEVQIVSRAQTAQELVLTCDLAGLDAVCYQCPDLNPAILLIRWPLNFGVQANAPAEIAAVAKHKSLEPDNLFILPKISHHFGPNTSTGEALIALAIDAKGV